MCQNSKIDVCPGQHTAHPTLHLLTALVLVAATAATGATAHQASASNGGSTALGPSADTGYIRTSQALGSAGRNGVDTVVLVVKYAAIATLLVLGAGLLYVVYVFGSLIFLTCNDCTLFNVVQLLLYGLANATIALIQSVGVFGDISWLYGITEDWVRG